VLKSLSPRVESRDFTVTCGKLNFKHFCFFVFHHHLPHTLPQPQHTYNTHNATRLRLRWAWGAWCTRCTCWFSFKIFFLTSLTGTQCMGREHPFLCCFHNMTRRGHAPPHCVVAISWHTPPSCCVVAILTRWGGVLPLPVMFSLPFWCGEEGYV